MRDEEEGGIDYMLAYDEMRQERDALVEENTRLKTCSRNERDYSEALENICTALGLPSTHYLVIADQVADVVRQRDEYKRQIDVISRTCETKRAAFHKKDN